MNRANMRRSEETEQMNVIDWANWQQARFPELKLLHHIPNGGKRSASEAARFKAAGVKAGVPDLHLPVPRGGFAGLYIEMKFGDNKPTEKQKEWHRDLKEQGFKVTVCYSAAEATQTLEEYLKKPRTILSDPASCRPQKRIAIYCTESDAEKIENIMKESAQAICCPFGGDFMPKDCSDTEDAEDCAACVMKNTEIHTYD